MFFHDAKIVFFYQLDKRAIFVPLRRFTIMKFWKHILGNKLKISLIVGALLLLAPSYLAAQFYNGSQLSFGKNRVQYQHFNWIYMRADQYDVYFYATGKPLAEYVYYKTPQFIEEIEKLLNFTSQKKLQFIIYNTQSDFRESNFAYDNEDFYNQGGVTNIYGTKIYLYFDGNREHFDRMLRSGIMNVYAHWLVQGQSVGSNISYETLMDVPNWYYSGLSSYFGEKWNSDIDAHVKDGILTQKYADFDELSPVDATYAGHSFWKFVVDNYGEKTIAHILYSTRSAKSFDKGFYYATGVPYRALLASWYKYYYILYHPDLSRSDPAGDGIVKHPKSKRDYSNFAFSPDGKSYAYVTNESGQVRIWLKTENKKRPKCILRRYCKIEDNPDLSFPLLAWHPIGTILGITLEVKGRCYYYPYNLETKKWEDRMLVDVEKISAWSYSDNGQFMLFSGFKNGQSDIFLYSFFAHTYQNLTNDYYDDYDPIFINHQKQIVFSSNRKIDSLFLKDNFMKADPQKNYDLFLYQYARKDTALVRITHTPYANEFNPQKVSDNEIVYLSDENGIINRYSATFDSTISCIDTAIHYAYFAKTHALTDRAYSILHQNYVSSTNTVADISLKDGVKRIYFTPLHLLFLPEVISTQFHLKQISQSRQDDSTRAVSDSIRRGDKPQPAKHGFFMVYNKPVARDTVKAPEDFDIPVGRFYHVQFSVDKLITQADFSFLNTSYQQFEGGTSPIYLNTGFNGLFMVGLNDLFEDYRLTGGVRLSYDLKSNEFMFSFEDLSRRLDRQIVLYRQSITTQISDYVYKQRSNSIFYILKFPFDKINSVRFTFTGRYENNVMGSLSDSSLAKPDDWHIWGGVKLEYIFDSSKELATNLWRGTKIKVFGEYEQRVEKETRNLFVIGVDARRAFKLYKNMTFNLRAAGSTNAGSARLVYFMGGMDNWINAKFNSTIWVDQTKNYAYQTLATNMRGFKQNIRNGTSFALLSAELRVPIVQMIIPHRISSNFFNSLQINLFGDYGTAWTGFTPYSEDNCLYTRYVTNGSITAEVKRQVDPFVAGFGVGLRASIFGYFVRADYAWGIEDFKIADKKGMLMFSIGTDF